MRISAELQSKMHVYKRKGGKKSRSRLGGRVEAILSFCGTEFGVKTPEQIGKVHVHRYWAHPKISTLGVATIRDHFYAWHWLWVQGLGRPGRPPTPKSWIGKEEPQSDQVVTRAANKAKEQELRETGRDIHRAILQETSLQGLYYTCLERWGLSKDQVESLKYRSKILASVLREFADHMPEKTRRDIYIRCRAYQASGQAAHVPQHHEP